MGAPGPRGGRGLRAPSRADPARPQGRSCTGHGRKIACTSFLQHTNTPTHAPHHSTKQHNTTNSTTHRTQQNKTRHNTTTHPHTRARECHHSDAVRPPARRTARPPVSHLTRHSWPNRPMIHATDDACRLICDLLKQSSPLLAARLAPDCHASAVPRRIQSFFHAVPCDVPVLLVVSHPAHDASHHFPLCSIESLQLRYCKRSR